MLSKQIGKLNWENFAIILDSFQRNNCLHRIASNFHLVLRTIFRAASELWVKINDKKIKPRPQDDYTHLKNQPIQFSYKCSFQALGNRFDPENFLDQKFCTRNDCFSTFLSSFSQLFRADYDLTGEFLYQNNINNISHNKKSMKIQICERRRNISSAMC